MNDVETFDLAFSFAGEDRDYVQLVKEACEALGLTVYYDEDRKIDQWGKSFISEQRKVYSGYKTKHFVPFISKHYFAKPIPTDEFRAALMESTKRSQYILPVKIDDSEVSVEYLHKDIQYLKKADYSPDGLAGALKYVVKGSKKPAKYVDQLLDDELSLPSPKITPRAYSRHSAAIEILIYVGKQFEKNLAKLKDEGFIGHVDQSPDKLKIIVERDGKSVFVMNMFFSNMGEDVIGFNFAQRSMMANAESINGMITPKFESKTQTPGYTLQDFSAMSLEGFHSKEGIATHLWNKMTSDIEQRFH